MAGVLIFYAIYVNVENAYLTPRIMRSSVNLMGLTVLVALLLGTALAGIVGALVKSGVPHEEAEVYEEGVRRGGTLVSVQAEEVDVPKVEAILDRRTTADWRTRREQYATSGWQPAARHDARV